MTIDNGGDVSITNNLTVGGIITAEEFHTEFVSASIIFNSGSTKFGDTSDDIHSFSGSLRVTGSGDHYITSGNVGIGTSSPQALLHVEGALSASGQITAADIVPYADDTEFLGGSANRWRVLYATRIQTDILREADGTNVLGMTGTTRDLYGTDGNVRISFEDDITFTNGDLVVPEYIYHSGDTNTFIRFQNDDINLTAGGSNLFRVDNTAPLREIVVNEAGAATNFRVESDTVTNALVVSGSNGNVGINESTPSQKLHVDGKIRATSWFTGADDTNTLFSSTSAGTILQTPGLTENDNNSKIFFRHSGGTVKFTFDCNSGDATFVGDLNVDTLTAVSIIETSTRELKDNIVTLGSQEEIVDKLQPVSYTWKKDGVEDFGLIAEDVEEIAPHLVSRDDNGNPTGIKYSKLSVLLLDVVKKQSTMIEDLNKRITKLEDKT
jgi:hypothetical protein